MIRQAHAGFTTCPGYIHKWIQRLNLHYRLSELSARADQVKPPSQKY